LVNEKLYNVIVRSTSRVGMLVPIIVSLLLSSCGKSGSPNPNFHLYGAAHAWLHLEHYGQVRGTQDVFIDSFGRIEARNEHSETLTPEAFRPTITYSVRRGPEVAVIDSTKKELVLLHDRAIDSMMLLSSPPLPEEHVRTLFADMGLQLVGDTIIQGLHSHIWQRSGSSSWMYEWHAIVIGVRNVEAGLENGLRLVSIDTVNPINPDRFLIHSNFPIKDLRKTTPEGN
jgi:hypothetical protein